MEFDLKHTLDVSRLSALGPEAHRRLVRVIEEVAQEIVEDAKSRAPERTGALKRSIHHEPAGDLEEQVVAEVDYANIVEHGGATRPAQPFLTPAAEAAKPGYYRRLAQVIREAVE